MEEHFGYTLLMSKISIVMPTKNRSHFLTESIGSIINQTFQDWDLVIVDDHGFDESEKIARSFEDIRIKYFYLEQDSGPGKARDFGIKKTQSELIVIADSDDINYQDRVELTYKAFLDYPDVQGLYGLAERLELDGTKTLRPSQDFDPVLLKMYNYIAHPTAAFRKKAYLNSGGYEQNLKTSEDYSLWLKFLDKNYRFHFINKPLVLQIIHAESTTSQTSLEQRKENLAALRKKHHLPIPKVEDFKKRCKNPELTKFAEKGSNFWFN